MHPAKKHITRLLPYLLYGIGSLSVIAAGCKKSDEVKPPSSPDIKMEMIPVSDTLRHVIATNTLLTANHPWYIDGWVYVTNEATLRVEAGATIHVLPSAVNKKDGSGSGGLIITRGAHIYASGTADRPIEINVAKTTKNGASGIIVLGKAAVEKKHMTLDNPDAPTLNHLSYGGKEPDDSSGVLKHLHINYYRIAGTGFIGGLLLLGTGNRTTVEDITLAPLSVKQPVLKSARLH
ncbi:MAG: hypothetical protein J7623_18675 [Chitinophaga sp.]|uniref:hypothetical protein n=1 Tax=Chitinophaga sp. TaxID=1869181 RepID=UPI001B110ED4|nr:hypothetical protein [Chitinophaga sp.]MBO9730675.1 hypothetical protein [Chitinophaga sp.]